MSNSWPIPLNNMCIYALVCPDTNVIKYIGKTKKVIDQNGIIYNSVKDTCVASSLSSKTLTRLLKKGTTSNTGWSFKEYRG